MPQYLDNIWSDQHAIKGFGDALNNNLASLVELRSKQRQYDQQNALNAAYYALERQKQMMAQPGMQAETSLRNAQAQEIRNKLAVEGEQQSRMKALNDAVQERFMQANPPQQREMIPGTPQGVPQAMLPMNMQGNAMMQTMPGPLPTQQGQVMGSAAPTMENQGRADEARIRAALIQQAAQSPSASLGVLQGNTFRPGDVSESMITGQRAPQIPGFVSPYQQLQAAVAQQREATSQQRADTYDRYVAEQERAHQAREDEPSTDKEIAQSLRDARLRKQGASNTAMPKLGEVRKGYRYKGGNPASQGSWEAVQ